LVAIAGVLVFGHGSSASSAVPLSGVPLVIAGATAGFGIGVVASLMGGAGGELRIPTIVLLFGVDIKLAGSRRLDTGKPFGNGSRQGILGVADAGARVGGPGVPRSEVRREPFLTT
jgi:hypothetical protein